MIRFTSVLLALTTALVIGYDVVAYLRAGADATISRVVQAWAHQHAALAFAWGVLGGHFFIPRTSSLVGTAAEGLVVCMWIGWVLLLLGWAEVLPRAPLWIYLASGTVAGWLFWCQPPIR